MRSGCASQHSQQERCYLGVLPNARSHHRSPEHSPISTTTSLVSPPSIPPKLYIFYHGISHFCLSLICFGNCLNTLQSSTVWVLPSVSSKSTQRRPQPARHVPCGCWIQCPSSLSYATSNITLVLRFSRCSTLLPMLSITFSIS